MKDLRKNQESFTATSGSDFSLKRFIVKWGKTIGICFIILAIIIKPSLIANVIGIWTTNFIGTLCASIKVDGVSSFNFILITTLIIISYSLINKWIRYKNPDKISGRG